MSINVQLEQEAVALARSKGLPPSMFLAFIEVETGGEPFEEDGRTPRFLFERHKFYEMLAKFAPDKLQQAVDAGLAHSGWKKDTQYKDLGTSAGRMRVLQEARAIDEECANRACSWGLGQIMGFNAEPLGYASATSMVLQFSTGRERAQLDSIIRFLRWKGLDDEVRRKDYEGLARGYNGKAYKKNNYHTKLESAEKRWEIKLGEVTAEEIEVPLPVPPSQNAETSIKDVLLKPEIIATGGAVLSGGASTISATAGVPAPIQYALAFIMVLAACLGGYYIFKRIRED